MLDANTLSYTLSTACKLGLLNTERILLYSWHCKDNHTVHRRISKPDDLILLLELLKSTMEKVMTDMEDIMKEIVELMKPKVGRLPFFFANGRQQMIRDAIAEKKKKRCDFSQFRNLDSVAKAFPLH